MTKENRYIFLFCFLSAIIPFLAIDVPRSIAFAPSIIGTFFYVGYFFVFDKKPYFSKKTLWLVLIIFGMSALSLLWAKFFDVSLKQVTKLAFLLPPQVLLISLVLSLPKDKLKPYIYLFPYALVLALCALCFEILTDGLIFNAIRNEPPEVDFNPAEFNRASVVMVLYFFSAIALLKTRIKSSWSALILLLPLIGMLSITDSQSSLLAFIMGVTFLFLFPYQYKIAWVGLKVIILALMLVAPFVVSYIYQSFAASVEAVPIMAQGYAGHRLEIWDYISRYILQQPWYGFGIEATRAVTDFDTNGVYNEVNTVLHPHNFVFQIWIEFGLIGIVIAMGLMWKILSMIEKNFTISQQKILLPTMMASIIPASTAYGMWQGWWLALLFHVAAMSLIAVRFVDEEKALR